MKANTSLAAGLLILSVICNVCEASLATKRSQSSSLIHIYPRQKPITCLCVNPEGALYNFFTQCILRPERSVSCRKSCEKVLRPNKLDRESMKLKKGEEYWKLNGQRKSNVPSEADAADLPLCKWKISGVLPRELSKLSVKSTLGELLLMGTSQPDIYTDTNLQLASNIPLLGVYDVTPVTAPTNEGKKKDKADLLKLIGEGATSRVFRLSIDRKEFVVKLPKSFAHALGEFLNKDSTYDPRTAILAEAGAVVKIQKKFLELRNTKSYQKIVPKRPIPRVLGYVALFDGAQAGGKYILTPALVMKKMDGDWNKFCQDNGGKYDCTKLNRKYVGNNGEHLLGHVSDMLEALRVIHAAGVAQNDLAPKNIMFRGQRSFIIDFGNEIDEYGFGSGGPWSPSADDEGWPINRAAARASNFDLRKVDLFGAAAIIEEFVLGMAYRGNKLDGVSTRNSWVSDGKSLGKRITTRRRNNWMELVDILRKSCKDDDIMVTHDKIHAILSEIRRNGEMFIPQSQLFDA